MKSAKNKITTLDDYIAAWPKEIQKRLQAIRRTIRAAAPKAEETISYQIPTFKYFGNLVHFAAFKNHIGFYPMPKTIVAFKKDLAIYKHAKGSIQFPLDKPVPVALVTKIVKYRVEENEANK